MGQKQMMDSGDCAPEAALLYLEAAIRIMDSCGAPPDIAAHADLAKAKLEDWISGPGLAGVAPDIFKRSVSSGVVEH